ncbi:MAG TPA: protein kinase [Myxococcota bacterium]|nr:protein kinase [Myxococcota bacterium]
MGEKFGKYELARKIAIGGMAEIFLATHVGPEGFKKHVAIKRILPHLTEDNDFVTMFLDEARLVARFNHPNLVQIFELGQVKKNYFLAMEYVQGSSMSKVVKACNKKQMPFPLEYGAKILSYACEGLEYAHNFTDPDGTPLNLIHRDVSPQNLMLSYDGVVKVLDFGIAKAAGNIYHTRTTSLKGKAAYMSPEQISQKSGLDRRSDVFSLGIVMFEFATGRRPFEGDTELELMMGIVQSPPTDPRKYVPDLPEDMARIILTALQKDRRQRYQSAREMRADLENFLVNRKVMVDSYSLANFLREIMPQGDSLVGYSVPTPSRPSLFDEPAGAPRAHTPSPVKKTPSRPLPPPPVPVPRGGTGSRPLVDLLAQRDEAPTMLTPSNVIRPLLQKPPEEPDKTLPRPGTGKIEERERKKMLIAGALLVLVIIAGAAAAYFSFSQGNGTSDADAGVAIVVSGVEEPSPEIKDAGMVARAEPTTAPDAGMLSVSDKETSHNYTSHKKKKRRRRRVVEPAGHPTPPTLPTPKPDAGTQLAVVEKPKNGSLMVFSKPWTEVAIDGVSYGSTPLDGAIDLKSGPHVVQLTNSSAGIKHRERIHIMPGKKQTLRKKFSKGFLRIFVKPFGTVYINGVRKGVTPLGDIGIYEGAHRLRVKCDRTGKEENRTINIKAGETFTIKLDLR